MQALAIRWADPGLVKVMETRIIDVVTPASCQFQPDRCASCIALECRSVPGNGGSSNLEFHLSSTPWGVTLPLGKVLPFFPGARHALQNIGTL